MDWGSVLGKIGLGIAAPFTGGASLAAMPMVDAISGALGKGAQAQANNRGTAADLGLTAQDQLERQLLAREEEKRRSLNDAYKNSMMASMAQNWKPASRPANTPNISFSPGPGQQGLPAANQLQYLMMKRMGAPDLTGQQGMPTYQDPTAIANKYSKPGIWEKIMGIGSAVAPIAGGIYGAAKGTK